MYIIKENNKKNTQIKSSCQTTGRFDFVCHEKYMKAALRQADKAFANDEVPVGAVIVKDGRIIARGHNLRENRQDSTLHAEIIAIRQACRKLGTWRLTGCTLYVTLEPCLMCAGAIIQSRLDGVVFGASDPKTGACYSVIKTFDLPLHHYLFCYGGILADESSLKLKQFFQFKRQSNKIQQENLFEGNF